MHSRTPTSLSWPQLLSALRACSNDAVVIRDGNISESAAAVRTRPAAKGTELCLFPGEPALTRSDLIERLSALSKSSGRRFASSARANISNSFLLIESVSDAVVDERAIVAIDTRRPTLGFNQSQQVGASTTLRSKRIKNG